MPRHRRGGSRLLISFWLVALMSSVAVVGGMSHPRAALAETGEETALPSETSSDEPTEEPEIECSGLGSAGPLPSGDHLIAGTVTNGTDPLQDIGVSLRSMSSGGLETTFSGSSGEFVFEGLGDDTYWLGFHDNTATYQSGFYDGTDPLALAPDDATGIVLSGADVTGIEAAMPPESRHSMSGRVTTFSGDPANFTEVTAHGVYFPLVGCDLTDTSGLYTIPNLRTGVYRVEARKSGLPKAHYPGQVAVAGDVAGIDIQFPETFSLTGTVLDDDGNPVDNIALTACSDPGSHCGFGFSGSAGPGGFEITGLPAGDYWIRQEDASGTSHYKTGYYGGENVFVSAFEDSARVTVPGGSITLAVEESAVVSGTLLDTNGDPVADALVGLCDIDESCFTAFSDATGAFTIGMPEVREVALRVQDFVNGVYPVDGYMQPGGLIGRNRGDAEVFIAGEADITGLALTLPFGGTIEGSVTVAGEPAQFFTIDVCGVDERCNQSSTDELGYFLSVPEFEGSYYVSTSVDGEVRYWYVEGGPPTTDIDNASLVPITAGDVTTITLALPGLGTPTPQGDGVQIALDDGTGTNPVSLTFDHVSFAGTSNLTASETGEAVPTGFRLGDPATYYDITTSAVFEGDIRVCVSYAGASFVDPAGVRLLHYDAGIPGWEDITDSPVDTENQVVCGITDSLSPFVIAERDYLFGGFMGPKAPPLFNDVKAGTTVGIQFSLGGDVGLSIFAAGSPQVRQLDCTTGVLDLVAQDAVGTLKYNRNSGLYTYNWVTQKSWKNTCRQVLLTFRDGDTAAVWYRLKP